MRMLPLVALVSVAAAIATGCTPAPITLKKLGAACATDDDCGSGTCRDLVCTVPCTKQDECPIGFDCGYAKPGAKEALCYKALYVPAEAMNYGVGCAIVAGGCGMGMNPCAAGFECLASLKCEANAICTKTCMARSLSIAYYYCKSIINKLPTAVFINPSASITMSSSVRPARRAGQPTGERHVTHQDRRPENRQR